MVLQITFFMTLCLSAGLLTAYLIAILTRQALRKGWVDRPAGRKHHDRPTPPIGGLIIIPLFMLLLPSLGFHPADHWGFFLGLTLIVMMGAWDDHFDLPAWVKLVGQGLAATLVVLSGTELHHLGALFHSGVTVELGWLAVPFTIVALVFLMNAMNLMDGVDGLAGGLAFIMASLLAVGAMLGHHDHLASACLLFMAIIFGFLVHNGRYHGHRKATVFLGDSGALALGLTLGWLAIETTMAEGSGLSPIIVAFIIMLPIFDTFALFLTRLRAGRGALTPGRDHLHHRLLARGFTPGQTTIILVLTAGGMASAALMAQYLGTPDGVLTVVWIVLLLTYTLQTMRSQTIHKAYDHVQG